MYVCSRCNATNYVYGDYGDHDWYVGESEFAQDCEARDMHHYFCDLCGADKWEEGEIGPHLFRNGYCVYCDEPQPFAPIGGTGGSMDIEIKPFIIEKREELYAYIKEDDEDE